MDDRPLRIAQLAPVAMPVRSGEGDSIEQLVSLLTEGLVARGHDVTLYATGDSVTSARLRAHRDHGYDADDELWDWQLSEMLHAGFAFEHAAEHDLVHAHDYHFALPFAGVVDVPLLETPHVASSPEVLRAYARRPDVRVAAVSEHQRAQLGGGPQIDVVPHGVDLSAFALGDGDGGYLLYLGRMIADKGPAEAVRIAAAAGLPLILAGPEVEDSGVDPRALAASAPGVDWVGRVGAAERLRLLRGAAALLFPVQYPEPFGLVLVEAMACGTPVLACALGAVPEIVRDGHGGFTAARWQDLAALVPAVRALDRASVRREALARFSAERMVDDYEALYRRILSGVPA